MSGDTMRAAQEALRAEEENEENMQALSAQAAAEAEIEAQQKDEVVFITIYKKDRTWINETKSEGQNREDRLHQVLREYREAVKAGLISTSGGGQK